MLGTNFDERRKSQQICSKVINSGSPICQRFCFAGFHLTNDQRSLSILHKYNHGPKTIATLPLIIMNNRGVMSDYLLTYDVVLSYNLVGVVWW